MAGAVPTTGGPKAVTPGAGKMLLLLFVINLVTYIDRYVLSAVLAKMQLDATLFEPTDPYLQTKLGSLTSAFMAAYMIFSPVFAWAGDYVRRWPLLGVGVILWSIASGLTGWAGSFVALFLTRCFVGIGEAAYGPVAPAMISDLYPVEKRGRVMAFFYLAIPVGSALGFVLGGQLAGLFGWRRTFELTFFGILLGLICFAMKEPPRSGGDKPVRVPFGQILKELWATRSFVRGVLGMTLTTFILGGVATWVPTYIFQKESRFALKADVVARFRDSPDYRTSDGRPSIPAEVTDILAAMTSDDIETFGVFRRRIATKLTAEQMSQYGETIVKASTTAESMSAGGISTIFGGITVVGGLLATMAGGWFGDWLRAKGMRGAYFHAAGWSTIAAWPIFVVMLFCPFPWAWGLMFVSIFLLFFNTGPANTILANVTRSPIRAGGFAVCIFVIHALGDAISPMLIGFIADLSNLQVAFLICSVFILLGGSVWVAGARYLDDDTKRAEAADAS
jgi:MFS family permease